MLDHQPSLRLQQVVEKDQLLQLLKMLHFIRRGTENDVERSRRSFQECKCIRFDHTDLVHFEGGAGLLYKFTAMEMTVDAENVAASAGSEFIGHVAGPAKQIEDTEPVKFKMIV